MINVTIYNEYFHEQTYEGIRKVYPKGIHNCIKDFLKTDENLKIRTATFDIENQLESMAKSADFLKSLTKFATIS